MEEKTLIEQHFNKYFPIKWTGHEANFFLDTNASRLDIAAISENLSTPIRDFVLRGGKRLRPLIFLKMLRAFNVKADPFIDLALVVELVHNATLILDDVEDGAKERRGKATSHITFGIDTAVNAGMALHILPLKIFESYKKSLSSEQMVHLWEIYTNELTNLSFGQALDIFWHKSGKHNITTDKYLEMVSLKTGSLFRMAISFASCVANKSRETEKDFAAFAGDIGTAFQIIDDVLDLSPNNERFGKSYGNDISEGKMSLPVLLTLKNASKEDAKQLKLILGKHTRNKLYIKQALKIINNSKSLEKARLIAENILNSSLSRIETKYGSQYNLIEIRSLALFLIKRDH